MKKVASVLRKDMENNKTTEIVCLRLEMEQTLKNDDARRLRGFFGKYYWNRSEFHQHGPAGLIYRHPLIQYKVMDGAGWIIGLKEGAFLLLAVEPPHIIRIGNRDIRVVRHEFNRRQVIFGITNSPLRYRFLTPWLPLNSRNRLRFERVRKDRQEVNMMLSKILIGNLISLSKAVRYTISDNLQASLSVELTGEVNLKPHLRMLGFRGNFAVNFAIPDFWGIGKSVSRGFGTIKRR